METPELIAAMLITAVALGVLVGVVTSWVMVDRFHRFTKARIEQAEKDIDDRNKILDMVTEIQLERNRQLDDREAIVTEHEQALRRSAKEAAAVLTAGEDQFDTRISLLDWPELNDPNQDADTVEGPR